MTFLEMTTYVVIAKIEKSWYIYFFKKWTLWLFMSFHDLIKVIISLFYVFSNRNSRKFWLRRPVGFLERFRGRAKQQNRGALSGYHPPQKWLFLTLKHNFFHKMTICLTMLIFYHKNDYFGLKNDYLGLKKDYFCLKMTMFVSKMTIFV